MPKLIIDGREVEVAQGVKVIEAAERLGILIPRFCYHPALGSVGACRVCAVKFLEGPVKGIQMSCMADAADGMRVSTTDPEAVDFRKHVIELLMLHHPHDCPVCDEGGHCLLQDMTVSGGHGLRRYPGNKRTHIDQDLGPLVRHEMNRCIQCYRCIRYYREFTGYSDLGVMGIGSRVYFGRQRDGILESPFSGNLIDICPTGVFTDKPSRFKGRQWDFERTPSVCIHCSLGCHTTVSVRYREVVRQEARSSAGVNGHFICDRGRYGFHYANRADRPREARIGGDAVPVAQALAHARNRLADIRKRYGNKAIACAGSARSSLETLAALCAAARLGGWRPPAFFTDTETAANTAGIVGRWDRNLTRSLEEIPEADMILVIGADPVNEAPMLAVALRQAWRNGAAVTVMDPRPVALPFPFAHIPEAPHEFAGKLLHMADAMGSAPDDPVAAALSRSLRPLLVCGPDLCPEPAGIAAETLVRTLGNRGKSAGLFHILPGANAFAAGLLTDSGASFEKILSDIEDGGIKALIVAEYDPFWTYPDKKRLTACLKRLELKITLDYVDHPMTGCSDIFLPTATLFEAGGVYVNSDGRGQQALPAFRGGIPISQTGGGDHPPRRFRRDIPGNDPLPAWRILEGLAGFSGDEPWRSETHPALAPLLAEPRFPAEGVRVTVDGTTRTDTPLTAPKSPPPSEEWILHLPEETFGTEYLSAGSPCLQSLEKTKALFVESGDARTLGLQSGDLVSLPVGTGTLKIPVVVRDNMAPGVLILSGQRMGASRLRLSREQIRKTMGDG